ncbi:MULTISPECIES: hypothetical protein [Pseudomonas]
MRAQGRQRSPNRQRLHPRRSSMIYARSYASNWLLLR